MKRRTRTWWIGLAVGSAVIAAVLIPVFANWGVEQLTATPYADVIRFEAVAAVESLQITIYDLSGRELWDSGVIPGRIIDWDRTNEWGERLAYGAYLYQALGWNAQGEVVFEKSGKLALLPGDKVQLQAAPPSVRETAEPSAPAPAAEEEPGYAPLAGSWNAPGNFTIAGNLGVGTQFPARAVHLQGRNACFRMDRDVNASAFLLTRTAFGDFSTIWKTFVVGTNATGVNNGEFIINDIGTNVSGGGARRLTIDNDGLFGINTDTPSATLTVHGSVANLLALYDSSFPGDTKFRVEKDGDVYADGTYYCFDGAFHVGSADVAERINTSEWVEPGYIVEIDPEHPGFFRKASSPYSTRVAGIISTSPGVVLGNDFDATEDKWEDNRPVLAIAGRVPLQVTAENGPIQIGDLLVSSSTPGVAMKGDPAACVGTVIGKAMEPLEEGSGVIMVQVMLR